HILRDFPLPPPVTTHLPSGEKIIREPGFVFFRTSGSGCRFASQSFTVSSEQSVAMNLPSEENAADITSSLWPLSVESSRPVEVSQILAVASWFPVARRRPSGEKCTESTIPSRPVVSVRARRPDAASHSFAVPSAPPVASDLPSGEKAIELIEPFG